MDCPSQRIGSVSRLACVALLSYLLFSGIDENIVEAYSFICNNYCNDHGDEIYLIGYSRGAFTVRCIARLIQDIGLLRKKGLIHLRAHLLLMEELQVLRYLQTPTELESALKQIEEHTRPHVRIQACAVWDTVSSVGYSLRFVHSDVCDNIDRAFQALALNEHRYDFAPIVWRVPANETLNDNRILEQCWFLGYHGDIGGGRKEDGLAHLALIWMMAKLRDVLSFDNENLWAHVTRNSGWKVKDTKSGIFIGRTSKYREPFYHFWSAARLVEETPQAVISNERMHSSAEGLLNSRLQAPNPPPPPRPRQLVATKPESRQRDQEPRQRVWKFQRIEKRDKYDVDEARLDQYEFDLLNKWLDEELRIMRENASPTNPPPKTMIDVLKDFLTVRFPSYLSTSAEDKF